jgi:hypothetical protein
MVSFMNLATLLMLLPQSSAFLRNVPKRRSFLLQMTGTVPNFNAVEVAKTGGQGAVSAGQKAVDQNLSLGAPRGRPTGGHYLTKGGVQVTANVDTLEFSKSLQPGTSEAAIEHLIEKLDSRRGALFTSSYEFPGRYARWSMGFIDPPLEISGQADKCTIRALNARGKILLPAIETAMQNLKDQEILSHLKVFQEATPANGEPASLVKIEATVVPPPEVGTFSEEERSRQVRTKSAPRLRDGLNFILKSVFFRFFHSPLCFQLSDLSWTCLDIRTATDNWDCMEPLGTI